MSCEGSDCLKVRGYIETILGGIPPQCSLLDEGDSDNVTIRVTGIGSVTVDGEPGADILRQESKDRIVEFLLSSGLALEERIVAKLDGQSDNVPRKDRAYLLITQATECSQEMAGKILGSLESRDIVRLEIYPPGGQLHESKVLPTSGFRWHRVRIPEGS